LQSIEVFGVCWEIAGLTVKGFAKFYAHDFKACRNAFYAHVTNASFGLRKVDRPQLAAVRAFQ